MTDSLHPHDPADDALWPSDDYHRQVARLRDAVGETIYLVELSESAINLGIHISGSPCILLAVIDFPRPDPTRGLAPHLILLDDGRGVNLGRVARISRRPFAPAADELLYLDLAAQHNLLFAERRLSRDFIADRARHLLGQVLGRSAQEPVQSLLGPEDISPRR